MPGRTCVWPREIEGAAVVGRVVHGPRARRPVQRLRRDRYAAAISPLHAHERHGLRATHGVHKKLEHEGEHLALHLHENNRATLKSGA